MVHAATLSNAQFLFARILVTRATYVDMVSVVA